MYFFLLENNKIIDKAMGECPSEHYVEVSKVEFLKADKYIKFNAETREFSEAIPQDVEIISEHETITKEVRKTTSMSAEDNLLNMDLLASIDDKLNLIMEHLGLC